MIVERSGFFLMAGVLAGGGAGWALRDSGVGEQHRVILPLSPVVSTVTPEPVKIEPVPVTVFDQRGTAPVCDDSIGTPEECPALGPAEEGVCSNFLAKRCEDYKAAFKPRVAQAAVACLNRLKGGERCDVARVNLCGHSALMAACPEPQSPATGSYMAASLTTPASFTLDKQDGPPSALTRTCESISQSCSTESPGPSFTECMQTLTGMTELGRTRTQECVSAHCQERGLIGCEAVPSGSLPRQARRQL